MILESLANPSTMMAHGRQYDKVNISFGGNRATIRRSTLRRYLPGLMRSVEYIPQHYTIVAEDYLDVREHSHIAVVLDFIFRYLNEVDLYESSGLLLDDLDMHWNRSRHGSHTAKNVFSYLGSVLGPDNFGCCNEIWSSMQQFFSRHCAEIMHGSQYNWTFYIQALQTARQGIIWNQGADLTSSLAMVMKEGKLNRGKLADITSRGLLCSSSINILSRLIYAKEHRDHQRLLEISERALELRGRAIPRENSFRGTSIDPYILRLFCERYPEAIKIDMQKWKQLEQRNYHRGAFDREDLRSPHEDADYYTPRFVGDPRQLEDVHRRMHFPGHDHGIPIGV